MEYAEGGPTVRTQRLIDSIFYWSVVDLKTNLVLLPFTTVTDGRDIYIPSLDTFLGVCTVVTLVHKIFFCNGSSALGLPVRSLLECNLTVNSQILSFPFD